MRFYTPDMMCPHSELSMTAEMALGARTLSRRAPLAGFLEKGFPAQEVAQALVRV